VSDPRENIFNRLTYAERITKEKAQYEQKKIQDAERKAADLLKSLTDANSFPELSKSTCKPAENACTLNFAEKVNSVKTEEVDTDWVENNKRNYGVAKRRHATPDEILKALCDRYEKWKAEHIELYGYDDYEHSFRFPGYDYEYFDKLDEKYEYEMMVQEEHENDLEDYTEHEQNTDYND
jgi:hypothetical protein